MSFSIMYDRIGIKLSNDEVLLLWCIGSSNCTQFNYTTRREVYERRWFSFDGEKPVKTVAQWHKYLVNICDKWFGDEEDTQIFTSHTSDSIKVIDFYNGLWNSVKRAKDSVKQFVDKGNMLYIMYNEKDNTDCMIAKEICVRGIYNEQGLRDYLKYVMDNGYSFRIGLKNRKRIKK